MVIKVWSNPYANTSKGGVLNDLGYSNVNGNTRMNDSKLDEIRKQKYCGTNQ